MAYVQLPTRTTADTASSADANQLQDNIDAILGTEAASGPAKTLVEKVTGPASVTDGRCVAFDGTTGKLVKADSRLAADLVAGPASSTDGRTAVFDSTTGKLLKQSSRLEADLVAGPASAAADGNIALFNGTGGKTIKDSTKTIAQVLRQTIRTETTNATLAAADENNILEINSGTSKTVTVPKEASVSLPIGYRVDVVGIGAGEVAIAAEDGTVTINSEGSKFKLNAQHAGATLYKRATNEWQLFGSLKT